MGLAALSSKNGQRIQKKAYDEIMRVYPDGDAWSHCLVEEKISYITALVKETLRFWTVIPISLPRVSIKDVEYKGAIIPAGTTFYMNAYAADYDEDHFKNPFDFEPERYMKSDEEGNPEVSGTPHYGYGAGSRMCAGSHLANRELFTAFVRMISAFEIVEAKNPADRPVMDCLEANALPTSLTMEPKKFKVGLKVRDRSALERWFRESEENTRHL